MLVIPESLKGKFFVYGLRTRDEKCVNLFDDYIGVCYPDGSTKQWAGTTKPGLHYLQDPINTGGTAILVAMGDVPNTNYGIYENVYKIALHQNKYEALCQRGNLAVFRDVDKDTNYDYDITKIEVGSLFGVNIHHAGVDSAHVDNWSAGCQVFKVLTEFNEFLSIVKAQNLKSYTYVLQNIPKFTVDDLKIDTNVLNKF